MAPSIVLIPGMSSLGTEVYAPLVAQLAKHSFTDTHPLDLPSIDCLSRLESLTPNPLEADIRHIRATLTQLVEKGSDVIIIAHSYGGTPALAAAEALWSHHREANTGGILKAILLSSSLSLPGGDVGRTDRAEWCKANNVSLDANAHIEMVQDQLIFYPENMEADWFNDLPDTEAKRWAETLRPCALGALMSPVPESMVGDWRVEYLVTEGEDKAMPEGFQRWLVERARREGAQVNVKGMKSGHFVQISHAEEVVGWVKEVCS
jgi:pimeloyl-ACP methyl ester carboxylesterase